MHTILLGDFLYWYAYKRFGEHIIVLVENVLDLVNNYKFWCAFFQYTDTGKHIFIQNNLITTIYEILSNEHTIVTKSWSQLFSNLFNSVS